MDTALKSNIGYTIHYVNRMLSLTFYLYFKQ